MVLRITDVGLRAARCAYSLDRRVDVTRRVAVLL
jgi:hypothetical protein